MKKYLVNVIIDGEQYGAAMVEGKRAANSLQKSLAKLGNVEDFQLEVTELHSADKLLADMTELFREEERDDD